MISLLLALVFDLVILGIGRLLMPWNENSGGFLRGRRRFGRVPASPLDVSAAEGAR